jgi:hypothetical protein
MTATPLAGVRQRATGDGQTKLVAVFDHTDGLVLSCPTFAMS